MLPGRSKFAKPVPNHRQIFVFEGVIAMVISSWLSFLNPFDGSNKKSKRLRKVDNTRQPRLTEAAGEQLETRVLPAANINIIAGVAGTGDQDANLLADGTINFADADIG